METIKRYTNRKLYSTKANKYVPLEYIADLIRNDERFQVIDNATKNDITVKTLRSALLTVDLSAETVVRLIRGN
jgi:polyhydroxyalkanoate synthesis regulator protein